MQHDVADDWVVATGETYSVKDFVIAVFDYFGLDWNKYVKVDDAFKRPNEVPALLGDSTKLRTKLGWKPEVNFKQLVKLMCDNDYNIELKHMLYGNLKEADEKEKKE